MEKLGDRKIQWSTSKTKAIIIMLLMLSMTVPMLALPTASAHTPPISVPTYAFLNCEPNPAGVGQTVFVTFWLDKVVPTANVAFGDRWENMTLKITNPDGTTKTLGPYKSDDVGGAYILWTPDAVGTYIFQFIFPGQTILGANPNPITGTNHPEVVGDYYLPSQSKTVSLVVQQQAIKPWPVTPLPTDYWARPINGMNPEWTSIGGDWLMSGYDVNGDCFNPYTQAPESAHIVWTLPLAAGGIVGGNYADWNYYTGLAYETKFPAALIMNGKLIINLPLSTNGGSGGTATLGSGGAAAYDLRTGKLLWWQNNTKVQIGQDFDYSSPNQFGIIPYLWTPGATYNVYDPWTGQYLFCLANASTGTTTYGPNGELLVYILNGARSWLAMWNSTKAIMYYQQPGVLAGGNVWQWRPFMQPTMDWMKGVQWNVTTLTYTSPSAQNIRRIDSGVILATTAGAWSIPLDSTMEIGYSTLDGHQMWAVNRTGPFDWNTLQGSPVGSGVYTEFHPETMTWTGYDITTGSYLWGPTDPYPNAFGVYSWQARIGYGKLFAADYGGYVHCYDVKTGKKLWDFYAGNSGMDTVYGSWPLNQPMAIADGKVYVVAGHAYNPPLFKGARVYCINATDGNLIWSELGFYTYNAIAIADGFMTLYNAYDGQAYVYGRGLTAATATVQTDVVSLGSSVLIKGTVTDQSPGQTCLGVPAAGTPAISDANMGDWMAYLYMQQPKPTNATGVTVHITALDPNNNIEDIGFATSDASGTFMLPFKPPVTGVYRIMATFDGSKAYYKSSAETGIYVTEAPLAVPVVTTAPTAVPTQVSTTNAPTVVPTATVAPTPSPVVIPPTSAAPTATYIAIGAVIIIVLAAVAALILRRRK